MYWLVWRRYAPFESFGGGFEGDNRGEASTNLNHTARTVGVIEFAPGHIGTPFAFSSGTEFVGLGARVRRMLGKHQSKVSTSVSVRTKSVDTLRFIAETSGANPMVPGAPAIDTYVHCTVVFGRRRMFIEGQVRGDDFPNAEVFVVDRVGGDYLLFDFKTSGGRDTGPMTRLWGDHQDQALGRFSAKLMLNDDDCLTGCAA